MYRDRCTIIMTVYNYKPTILRNSYFPHRWGILLFTPPPGSRARRLGWSQYMHECVGASQGYRGVVGGLGLGLGLAVGWLLGSWRWGKYGFAPPVWGFRCTRGST